MVKSTQKYIFLFMIDTLYRKAVKKRKEKMTCHKWLKCRWNIGLGGNSMNIKELLKSDFVILDGAMGTMLQQKGMEVGTVPETLNILKPMDR